MEYLKQFIKKNWIIITLAIIIAGAIFIRTYNFSEWLYFRSDQVRDAKLIYEAFQNGPGELPLLGPRAAGTYLRLGPIFYYFQYFSAKLFNSVEPAVFAYPDLFFSILTIPLLFIFAGKFFSRKTSLMITALYAFSFIIVQYSRFGWNPNSLPFWGLLFILSIYNASTHKDNKKAGWFLVLAGLAYAVVSQLHFIALVGFPIIAFLFGIFYFPRKINWKYWLGALAVIAFFYIPVILSDVKTGGDNWDQFIYAITAKTENDQFTFVGNIKQICIALFMFLTSFGHKDAVLSFIGGALLVIFGLIAMAYFWKTKKEKRAFVYLTVIWFFVFVGLQIKTNISLKPRFFMPIAALPFIFWGMIYTYVKTFKVKALSILAFLSFPVFLLANFNGIKIAYSFFGTQDYASVNRHIFIKQDDAKTLGQIKKASKYMASQAESVGKIVCFYSPADYERSYEYVFEVYHPEIKYDRISKSIKDKTACLYFSIATARDDAKKMSARYQDYFIFKEVREFGQIAVWDIAPTDEFINYSQEDEEDEEKEEEKMFEDEISEEEIEKLEEKEKIKTEEYPQTEKKDPPGRKERVFWKHFFSADYES
jgi:hypothetical protein